MILKESVMTNRRRKGWRCRELVKSLRKKAGGVEATGKPPERGKLAISRRQANRQSEKGWRYRGDRQTARVRKAGGKISRLKYRQRKAGGQSDFRIGMSAAHRRFREIKTPAMHIPVKMIKAIRITRIKISGDASAREASPIQQVTMIVTITMLMV